jgi:hypothetical protein
MRAVVLCVLASMAVLPARVTAAGPAPLDHDVANFTLNVCAEILGRKPEVFAASVKQMDFATVHPPAPIPGGATQLRESLLRILEVSPDTALYRVTFKSSTPKLMAFAFVRPDLKSCVLTVVGSEDAGRLIAERVGAPGSPWHEIYGREDLRSWQRKAADDLVVTLSSASGANASTISMITEYPVFPTIAEFGAFADSIRDPCVRAVLGDAKPDPAPFSGKFETQARNPDGSVLLIADFGLPGARLLLVPTATGSACMFAVDDSPTANSFRRALIDSFMRLPDVEHFPPPNESWSYRDPDSKRGVALFTNTRENMLVITFERYR